MLSLIRKRVRGGKGFTLIELLVVIIIIAILAAIAIPTFLGQRQKAQDANAKSLVRNAMSSIESAYVDTRDFSAITEAMLDAAEPSIDWVVGGLIAAAADAYNPAAANANAGDDQVAYFAAAATPEQYAAGSASESTTTFGVEVDKGVGGDQIFYIDGAAADW